MLSPSMICIGTTVGHVTWRKQGRNVQSVNWYSSHANFGANLPRFSPDMRLNGGNYGYAAARLIRKIGFTFHEFSSHELESLRQEITHPKFRPGGRVAFRFRILKDAGPKRRCWRRGSA